MAKRQISVVEGDEAGIRLDRWFKRHFPDLTHGQLQKLLRTGQIRLNGKRAESATRLEAGQEIRVPPQLAADEEDGGRKETFFQTRQTSRDANDIKKMILYEDSDVLVLNKPAGLAVQGGTGLRTSLDQMLAALEDEKQGKPRLVHRLDRDTSGVLLVARTVYAAEKLAQAFRARATQKIYWGVTVGVPDSACGEIDAPLAKRGAIMVVPSHPAEDDRSVKTALTLYQTVERVPNNVAFVAMWPKTGRTHQLRAHMAYMGTPLLGDRLYGKPLPDALLSAELGEGLHLHARRLIIPHPRKGVIDVTAPLSPVLRKTWRWFGFDEKADVDFSSCDAGKFSR
ncbi:MAG: RluA family pseudouridine synthase [Alphaproteobacteria bacterium]|nr:RluA family pseudouridine synthase [Alphaproteobacteria bacterium]